MTICPLEPFTWAEAVRLVLDMDDGGLTLTLCPICRAYHVERLGEKE